jgi:hypothetical protein
MATTADGTGKLGPGELKIGEIGTEIDVSCLVNNAVISPNKDEGDATTKLCGTTKPGSITYAWTLSGNVDVDAGMSAGLFALSWSAKGTQVAYTYTPSYAMGTVFKGTLVIDPLSVGADEYGADLTSDFEWAITSDPTDPANIVWGDAAAPPPPPPVADSATKSTKALSSAGAK